MNLSTHFLLTISGGVPHDIQMIHVTVMLVIMFVSVREKSLKGTALLEELQSFLWRHMHWLWVATLKMTQGLKCMEVLYDCRAEEQAYSIYAFDFKILVYGPTFSGGGGGGTSIQSGWEVYSLVTFKVTFNLSK